jgi:hypothetical protein
MIVLGKNHAQKLCVGKKILSDIALNADADRLFTCLSTGNVNKFVGKALLASLGTPIDRINFQRRHRGPVHNRVYRKCRGCKGRQENAQSNGPSRE